MATETIIVLPGDEVPQDALPTPTGKKKHLTLGPGLRHIPPNTVATTIAGALVTDSKKVAAYIETNSGRVSLLSLFLAWHCTALQIESITHPCHLSVNANIYFTVPTRPW